MDPSYQNLLDPSDLVWTLIAYLIHSVAFVMHAGLAGFLLFTGAQALLWPHRATVWLRRLGVTGVGGPRQRTLGALRLALGIGLLAPLVAGAPSLVSVLSAIGALVLLLIVERGLASEDKRTGRWARGAAIACAAAAVLFMSWEREDSLALGADLVWSGLEWRNEELAWQLEKDPASPKVGDLAPDFELQDPEGRVQVRLSDFRGKRPVALVFGSYT